MARGIIFIPGGDSSGPFIIFCIFMSILSCFLCNAKSNKKKQKPQKPTPNHETTTLLVPLAKVAAMEDYEAKKDDELTIKQGQEVNIIKREQDGLSVGIVDDKLGRFPTTVIEKKLLPSELV